MMAGRPDFEESLGDAYRLERELGSRPTTRASLPIDPGWVLLRDRPDFKRLVSGP